MVLGSATDHGVPVFVFLHVHVHVLDTSFVRVSPEVYDAVVATYKNPVVEIAEVGLDGAVAFHPSKGCA